MRHARPEGLHHLQGALKTVRDAGLDVLCPQYRAAELQHFYRIQHESRTLSRRSRRQRGFDVPDSSKGKPGRPASFELRAARTMARLGVPYVTALYMTKPVMETNGPMRRDRARKLKSAMDRAYRDRGIEPPQAPRGWWRRSLGDVDAAGWPDGWLTNWSPMVTCAMCRRGETDVRALMDGQDGVDWYTVHRACVPGTPFVRRF